jgi:arylsulfatase A-like enzyme
MRFDNAIVKALCVALLPAAMAGSAWANENLERRPDIVLIMADDMGFSDLGSYGGEINTPNLDALAKNGLRYRTFYNQARCMPTRAALLTGRYAHQTGLGEMGGDRGKEHPGYRGNINHQSVTLAEVLRLNGYRTYMSGKWHLTNRDRPNEPIENKFNWPLQRGFDRYFGTITGAGSFFGPHTLTRDNTNIDGDLEFPWAPWSIPPGVELPVKDEGEFYYTDVINETGARFIREHHQQHEDKPLFLYVSHTAPHWPLHAPEEGVDRYLETYRQGWDKVRRGRYERMIEIGVIDPAWKLSERPSGLPAWEDLKLEEMPEPVRDAVEAQDLDVREELARRMAVHAAMVDRMDQGIAEIVKALRETGRFENTLILFLSDNGAAAEWGTYGFGWPRLANNGATTGSPQSYASIGVAWAHVSNAPFRLWKIFNHEGGTATPFIAHWPAGIDARGEWRDYTGHIIDMMPTLLEVTGSVYPAQYGGHQIERYEGVSLVPSFSDESLAREGPLFFEHLGRRAVRDGKWKLVTSETGQGGRWKLYDMEADRVESTDLANQHPERVGAMAGQWQEWAERANVVPMLPDQ